MPKSNAEKARDHLARVKRKGGVRFTVTLTDAEEVKGWQRALFDGGTPKAAMSLLLRRAYKVEEKLTDEIVLAYTAARFRRAVEVAPGPALETPSRRRNKSAETGVRPEPVSAASAPKKSS